MTRAEKDLHPKVFAMIGILAILIIAVGGFIWWAKSPAAITVGKASSLSDSQKEIMTASSMRDSLVSKIKMTCDYVSGGTNDFSKVMPNSNTNFDELKAKIQNSYPYSLGLETNFDNPQKCDALNEAMLSKAINQILPGAQAEKHVQKAPRETYFYTLNNGIKIAVGNTSQGYVLVSWTGNASLDKLPDIGTSSLNY